MGDLALGPYGSIRFRGGKRQSAPSEISHGFRFWSKDIVSENIQTGSVLTYSVSLVFLKRISGLFAIPERNKVIWFIKVRPLMTYFDSVHLFSKYLLSTARLSM